MPGEEKNKKYPEDTHRGENDLRDNSSANSNSGSGSRNDRGVAFKQRPGHNPGRSQGILEWIIEFFVTPIARFGQHFGIDLRDFLRENIPITWIHDLLRRAAPAVETVDKAIAPEAVKSPETAGAAAPNLLKTIDSQLEDVTSILMYLETGSAGLVDVTPSRAADLPPIKFLSTVSSELREARLRSGLLPFYQRHLLSKYTPFLPGYADMISVYVREGYLEEKWVEIPAEFVENMKELGYPEYWTQRLWGKHWVLPDVQLLYDMFHKKIIDYGTLTIMLKYHDFEPVWRDRLIKNAYVMVPRVDLRRAYRYAMLKAGDLKERYSWLGYKDADADLMAGIAERWSLDRYYTRLETVARAAFRKGSLTADALKAILVKVNTPAEAIPLIIEAETLARGAAVLEPEEEPRVLTASQVVSLHRTGTLPFAAAKARLTKMGFLPEDADLLLHLEPNLPSSADMRWMVEWNVIAQDALTKYLIDGGMDPAWAPKVAEAWLLNQLRDEFAKVRGVYERSLRAGFMKEKTFAEKLTELHYAPHVIEALTTWAEEELDLAEKIELADEYEKLAKDEIITVDWYVKQLRELGMVEERITRKEKHMKLLLGIKAAKEAAKKKA